MKIAVQAPPFDGRANEALLAWIAAKLHVPRRHVRIVSGLHDRDKLLAISEIRSDQALGHLKNKGRR